MNDYSFGNYLSGLRRRAGMTQRSLARQLDVTDKAVSKWENGAAKPTTDMLRKIACIFGVSVENLLNERERGKKKQVTKIVLTGGPCAGKTTAMSWIQNYFTKLGYAVLFVPETATELISGGLAPWTCSSGVDFQRCLMRLQMEKEKVFEQGAEAMKEDKVLIVCDRGVLDNKAYMTGLEFSMITSAIGKNEVELRDNYDAVFHLVTAAKGAAECYTTVNNTARTEMPEQAALLDDKLIAAWTGHPHLRIIDNSTTFEDKLKRVLAEITAFLGEPEPYEIERKYLIEYPDTAWLEAQPNCRRVEIIQAYLKNVDGSETRVRQRGADGHYIYCMTTKKMVSDVRRVEIERRLTQDEYLRCLMDSDPDCRPIRKTRYCLTYENQYFEIDVYPFWQDRAIVEIELRDEQTEVKLPGFLKVIREVTGEESYKNASLARLKA